MITIHCRICGREFTTQKDYETGWGELMTRMGIHVKGSHPAIHAEAMGKGYIIAGYAMLTACVRIPDNQTDIAHHLAEYRAAVMRTLDGVRETTEAAEHPN